MGMGTGQGQVGTSAHVWVGVRIRPREGSPDFWQLHSTSLPAISRTVSGFRMENGASKAIMEKISQDRIQYNTMQYCVA